MSSQAELDQMQFFITPEHDCSYLPDRQARTLFLDPRETVNQNTYSELAQIGFRRSGSHLYRPHCASCQQCIPVRIPVAEFKPHRRHRRVGRINNDLEYVVRNCEFDQSVYQLYEKYIGARHRDGDMYPPSPEQFRSFLLCHWSNSFFGCLYQSDKLLAVAVTDQLENGLSAIYTFFDPAHSNRSLGVYSIMQQIEKCQRDNLRHLYLGYWIPGADKMQYKEDYRPLEILRNNRWQRLRIEPIRTESDV